MDLIGQVRFDKLLNRFGYVFKDKRIKEILNEQNKQIRIRI